MVIDQYHRSPEQNPDNIKRQWKYIGDDPVTGEALFAPVIALEPLSIGGGGAGAGTEYVEDAAAPANPSAPSLSARRRDALGAETTTDGDWVTVNATNKGELYIKHLDSIAVTGTFFQATQPVSGTFWQATQPVSGTFWQATQPVSGPLTDAQLRATPVPVSGTFWQATQPVSGTFWQATQPVSGPLTDAQLRALAVPVSGPLTDAQLRASAVPVSGPLTDAQLRASAVPTNDPGLADTLGQKTMANSAAVVIASDQAVIPVSDNAGSLTVDQATAANLNAQIVGELAHDAVDSGNPIKIGGKVIAAAGTPSFVSATGDRINAALDGAGRIIIAEPVVWTVTHAPAANTVAIASKAAGAAGVKHVLEWLHIACHNSGAATAIMLLVNVRDGATGAGTILMTLRLAVAAATLTEVNKFLNDLHIVGSAATAMTVEFSAAGGANTNEIVTFGGYDTL